MDPGVKEKFLGRPVRDVATDVEFWHRAGYDYISLRPGYEFPDTMPGSTTTGTPGSGRKETDARSVSVMGPGVIADFPDLETYPWPSPYEERYYTPLQEAAAAMPPGMGLVSGVGGIFTRTWMLLGLVEFCCALTERPDLVSTIFNRVGSIQCEVLRRVVRMERVVAIWYGDDLAYTESTIVSPEVYRKHLFPWMEELSSIAHGAGLPFVFHSDGRLWEVIPDLIALGLNGLHPIEPKAMDINEVKARYGKKLALVGNIDMDILARGTPAQVRAQVRQRIKDLAPGGGYAVGANPGVSDYVLPECYKAMREAAFEFGRYPIRL
jgi:uroporphyrinogen decarboxylase